jgi:hypothetical protein
MKHRKRRAFRYTHRETSIKWFYAFFLQDVSYHLKGRGQTITIESYGRVAMGRINLHSTLKRVDRVADSGWNQDRKRRDAKS